MSTPERRIVASAASTAASTGDALDPAESAQVTDLLLGWARVLRAQQLYEGQSPVYDRFVEAMRERLRGIWEWLPSLTLTFEEDSIRWQDVPLYEPESRSDPLHFPFYKDGVRELTFFPGFEDEELGALLAVLRRAHHLNRDEDDLLTLLWEREWSCMDYHYVDVQGDEMAIPPATAPQRIPASAVRQEAELVPETLPEFDESLYFLDDAELRRLAEEVRLEFSRDLWNDVLNAMLDRMDDGDAARQEQIVSVFAEVLPMLLGGARHAHAARVLDEISARANAEPALPASVQHALRALLLQLAEPATIEELIRSVEDSPGTAEAGSLAAVLGYFPPEALAPLLRAAEATTNAAVREAILPAAERLARADPERLIPLLAEADPATLAGAARLAGRTGHAGAVPALTRMLEHPMTSLRVTAIEALGAMRSAGVGGAVAARLADPDREVRIAAARSLGALRYPPARQPLLSAISSPRIKEVDVTERIAFFEAFGSVAGEEAVAPLARILNGRSWMGRRESADTRACAALGLARTRSRAAARELTAAAADAEPAVRTAVARALRVLVP